MMMGTLDQIFGYNKRYVAMLRSAVQDDTQEVSSRYATVCEMF